MFGNFDWGHEVYVGDFSVETGVAAGLADFLRAADNAMPKQTGSATDQIAMEP